MHSILGFCYGILAFSTTTVFASYPALPRKLGIRDPRFNDTSRSMPLMTSSSNSTSSTHLSSSSTTPIDITTSSQPSCIGSVTYYATTPPTVYQTITIPFTVTVTAANVSLTTPAIYTPPPPCFHSVMTTAATTTCQQNCPFNNPGIVTATYTGSAYTSTVLVTKKTPVPTVIPDTSPPPNFNIPSTSTLPSSPAPAQNLGPGSPAPETTEGQGPQITTGAEAGQTAAPHIVSSPTAKAGTTATVSGVPVFVLSSSSGVVIGGQVVSIPPSGSQTKVVANGNTFTLGNSAIIGPGTTIALAADRSPAGPTPVTANGLTFQVGVTQAIISGQTYAIGAGAPKTTLTIDGETVVVGPSGVGVPGETVAPAKATLGSSMSVVTAGRVTITYDGTEAIIGSSTYRIGQGAPQTTIIVHGKTVSLGAGGIGLASSTIPPAKATAPPSLSAMTLDGVGLSIGSSEVVIGSSTFRIGPGAPTETTVINGHTISIGPSGVGLPSTTIHPPSATAALHTGGTGPMMVQRLVSSSVLVMATGLLGCLLV